MVDSTNWLFDIFSWEHLAAIASIFAILVSTAIIPVWQLHKKRKTEHEKQADEKETQKIKDISYEILKPVVAKIDEHDELVREIRLTAKQNDKNTYDTLSTVRALVSEFHQYKDQQYKINAKLYFLDGAYQSRPENARSYKDWRTISEDINNGDNNDHRSSSTSSP